MYILPLFMYLCLGMHMYAAECVEYYSIERPPIIWGLATLVLWKQPSYENGLERINVIPTKTQTLKLFFGEI